jgi:hypothetical protein
LLQYFPGLKIQRESKEHDPASSKERRVSQINPPIVLHHPQHPTISNVMRTQVDHGLSSNGLGKLSKTKIKWRRAARAETRTMLILKIF